MDEDRHGGAERRRYVDAEAGVNLLRVTAALLDRTAVHVLCDGVVDVHVTQQLDLHAGLTFRSCRINDREVVVTEDRLVIVKVGQKPVDFFRGVAAWVERAIYCTVTSDVASEGFVVCREVEDVDVADDTNGEFTRRSGV